MFVKKKKEGLYKNEGILRTLKFQTNFYKLYGVVIDVLLL